MGYWPLVPVPGYYNQWRLKMSLGFRDNVIHVVEASLCPVFRVVAIVTTFSRTRFTFPAIPRTSKFSAFGLSTYFIVVLTLLQDMATPPYCLPLAANSVGLK